MVAAVLLMGLGAGITYWALAGKLKREWAEMIPARPAAGSVESAKIDEIEARIKSGDLAALADLARVYEAAGAFAPALKAWDALLAVESQRAEWWLNAAELQAAAGETRVAKQRLGRARELGFSEGAFYWRLGQLAESLGEQVDAKADYLRAVDLDATLLPAWLRLIAMYRSIGDEGEARRTFEAALAAHPDAPELLLDRGKRFRDRGNWEQAVTDFERVMELEPDLVGARYATAQAYFQMDRRDEGNALLLARLEDVPDDEVALMLLCVEALARGERAEADQWLARLRELPVFGPQDAARLRAVYQQEFGEPPPE